MERPVIYKAIYVGVFPVKLRYLLVLMIILSVSVTAVIQRECLDRMKPGMNCSVVSSAGTDCSSNYILGNITNGTFLSIRNESLLTLEVKSGVCYTTINQSNGVYSIVFNDTNETRIIVVDGNTNDQIITEVDSVEENQATLLTRILDIWNWLFASRVEVYFNNSLSYPSYDIITYSNGSQANHSYNYYTDNVTIKNKTISII